MSRAVADERVPVDYQARFRAFAIKVAGSSASDQIRYCPWCGERLPEPLTDEYSERLEALGHEPNDPGIPLRFRSDAWWRLDPPEEPEPLPRVGLAPDEPSFVELALAGKAEPGDIVGIDAGIPTRHCRPLLLPEPA
jgi:hypothetical protein